MTRMGGHRGQEGGRRRWEVATCRRRPAPRRGNATTTTATMPNSNWVGEEGLNHRGSRHLLLLLVHFSDSSSYLDWQVAARRRATRACPKRKNSTKTARVGTTHSDLLRGLASPWLRWVSNGGIVLAPARREAPPGPTAGLYRSQHCRHVAPSTPSSSSEMRHFLRIRGPLDLTQQQQVVPPLVGLAGRCLSTGPRPLLLPTLALRCHQSQAKKSY